MTGEELEDLLAVARDAAREAAALVARGYRKHPRAEHKGDVDLVTAYDRDSEARIKELLRPLGIPVLGEELGGSRPESGLGFLVDPLDGTTNFVHGHPFWCVSIGLADGATPILGVVVSPPLATEWWGFVAGDGARVAVRRTGTTEERCAVTPVASLDDALLATGFPYDRRTSADDNFDAFVAIMKKCQGVRRCGSAALDLCLVSDGTYEGYWERKLSAWDIAAGTAIVRAAGGRVTDPEGGDAFLASGHVVATNGVLHDALLRELAEVAPRAPMSHRRAP